jgi:LysR family transcriptional regulator, hydrogen peroxide-inducible genes activator
MKREPHAFSLRQLQYAVTLAETLSFRKAAELCHVSQPSLSGQLAELETALGLQLFERDQRRVLLTNAGRELVERARRVLLEAEDLLTAARRVRDPLSGSLRIGIIPTVSPYLLPSAVPVLRARYPLLSVLWVEEKTVALARGLIDGSLDGVVGAMEAPGVESEVIAKDAFVLATPRGHPLGEKTAAATQAELRGVEVLLLDDGHCFHHQALAFCAEANARELEFRATSLLTLTQMVMSGLGVTLLPLLSVATESQRPGLRVRKFEAPAPHRTIRLVFRRGSPVAIALRHVAAALRDAYPLEKHDDDD